MASKTFTLYATKSDQKHKWIYDLKAINKIGNSKHAFKTLYPQLEWVQVGNCEIVWSLGPWRHSSVHKDDGKTCTVLLISVMFAPEIMLNMISKNRMRIEEFKIIAEDGVNDSSNGIQRLEEKNTRLKSLVFEETHKKLYDAVLNVNSAPMKRKEDTEILHVRLCYMSKSTINQLKLYVKGLENVRTASENIYTCCQKDKSTCKTQISLVKTSCRSPLNRVYSNVVVSIESTSPGGSKYFCHIIGSIKRTFYGTILKRKSMVGDADIDKISNVENEFNQNLRTMSSI